MRKKKNQFYTILIFFFRLIFVAKTLVNAFLKQGLKYKKKALARSVGTLRT